MRLVPQAGGKTKKAKVKVASDDMLLVRVPKLSPGVYDVSVANKVGEATYAAGLTVTEGPSGPGGGGVLRMTLASDEQALVTNQFVAQGPLSGVASGSFVAAFAEDSAQGPILILTALMTVNNFQSSIGISLGVPFDPGVTPTPYTIQLGDTSPIFSIQVEQEAGDEEATWSDNGVLGDPIPGSFTVTSASASRVEGVFAFTVPPSTLKSAAAGDLEITNGEFDVPLTPSP